MAEFRLLFLIVCSVCFVNIQALTKMQYLKNVYPKFAKLIKDLSQEANLNNADTNTVLAPSDAAITAAVSAGTLGATDLEKRLCIQTHFITEQAFTQAVLVKRFATKTLISAAIFISPTKKRTLVTAEPKRGGKVYFNKYKNNFYVDDAKLEKEFAIDTNNVIRGIDKVLCPFNSVILFSTNTSPGATPHYLKTGGTTYFNRLFMALAKNRPNSVMLSSVDSSLAGGTYFVPLDKHLTEDDPNDIEYLNKIVTELEKLQNIDKLEKILESHIIIREFFATAFLENDKEYPTSRVGTPIKVARKPADATHPEILRVISGDSYADVIKPDELIGNGVVHGISGILNLLYKTLYAEIMANDHTASFKDLILRAEDSIKNTLKNRKQNYTIFAVDKLGINDNEKIIALQSDQLTKALEKAIVPGEVLTLAKLKTMDGRKILTQNGEIEVKVEYGEVRIICGQVKARIVKSDVETTNGIIQVLDLMLCVGAGTTVYDIVSKFNSLSTLKKYFDDFGFADVLKGMDMKITVVGAVNSAFDDARKSKTELDNLLLKNTTKTDTKYINAMKQFLSLFILTGAPKIEPGMTANLEARKVNASDETRTVGFKGDVYGVKVNYKAQSVDLVSPYSMNAINGQLVFVDDVLWDLEDTYIKAEAGQVLGAATAKLHTGLALALMVFVMRFWWRSVLV